MVWAVNPSITDWITASASVVAALGIVVAVGAFVVSRRQLHHGQLALGVQLRQWWESTYLDRQRGLAVMTWFVFPDRTGVSSLPMLTSDSDDDLARDAAFALAYHTHGPAREFEAAARRAYQFLYQLAWLNESNRLTIPIIYTFFGRDLIRHWSAIRGFVRHWPPSENFPHQMRSIEGLLLSLADERKRRRDHAQDFQPSTTVPAPDVMALLRRGPFTPPNKSRQGETRS